MIGPSGAGKEILANAIHASSRRRQGPFVTINCSALSESLIESELFGHVRGSFTGATHDRKGAFEIARGGTIFLDEIGDLPLSLQPKLLRTLENKEIRPVGSDRTVETDVRVIAATHKDLEGMVYQNRFREDLYWRLNVCSIRPPALRDRMEDFTDLVYFFCKQMRVRLSYGAIESLKDHSWPGNIRELKNVISRASAYYPGHHIQAEEIETLIDRPLQLAPEALHLADPSAINAAGAQNTGGSVMREIEREMIIRRLVANHGNQRKTAIDLGMPKSTLHDRLKTYSIDLAQIKTQA
jgi:transcriptional regulator with GAF, ATPase, and Fis domain